MNVRSRKSCAHAAFFAMLIVHPLAWAGSTPTLSGVFPNGANVAGGNSVSISGSNLGVIQNVSIGGLSATVLRSDANSAYVSVPAHAEGAVDVVVQTSNGNASLPLAFVYSTDFDPSRDFSAVQNPVGAWTYGVASSGGQPISTDAATGIDGCLDTWSGSSFFPVIGRNRTDATCNQYTWSWPAGLIGFHPGDGPEQAVIRWTAPQSGTYAIAGAFTCIDDSVACTVQVAIRRNLSQILFDRSIAVSHVAQAFALELVLDNGDTIDFAQNNGGNNFSFDQTVLDAHIEFIALFRNGFED